MSASAHPELAALHRTHGLTALEALVRRGRLTSEPASVVFLCDTQTCRQYYLTLDDAVAHHADRHGAYADVVRAEFGTVGVRRMVEERMKCAVVMDDQDAGEHEEEEEDETDEETDEETDDEEEEPGTIVIAGVGSPMLAETVVQLADLIRRGTGPRAGGWGRAMREGKVQVHFDHRNGGSGICSVRTDERVALLKRVMEFGVVKIYPEEE